MHLKISLMYEIHLEFSYDHDDQCEIFDWNGLQKIWPSFDLLTWMTSLLERFKKCSLDMSVYDRKKKRFNNNIHFSKNFHEISIEIRRKIGLKFVIWCTTSLSWLFWKRKKKTINRQNLIVKRSFCKDDFSL